MLRFRCLCSIAATLACMLGSDAAPQPGQAVEGDDGGTLMAVSNDGNRKRATNCDTPPEIKNDVGMTLRFVPPGTFTMGSPVSEIGREAQETPHEVELTRGFYLGAHEVTLGQFKQFVAETKFHTDGERDGKGGYGIDESGKIERMHAKFTWKSPGFEQTDNHPVVNVSWTDAKAFCNWLSARESKSYRLPSEAEWEYACRAGTKTAYSHGDAAEGLADVGNGADGSARAKFPEWSKGIKAMDGHVFAAPVGRYKPNALGLHDMHGNVWEWCEDWYVPNSYPRDKQVNPTGPVSGNARVQRGGGWSSDTNRLRSAARIGRDPSAYRGCYLGFRVVLEQADEKSTREPLRIQPQGNGWSDSPVRLRAFAKAAGWPTGIYDAASATIDGKPGPVTAPGCRNGKKKPFRECKTLKSRLEIAEEIAEFGFKHNPSFKVLWPRTASRSRS